MAGRHRTVVRRVRQSRRAMPWWALIAALVVMVVADRLLVAMEAPLVLRWSASPLVVGGVLATAAVARRSEGGAVSRDRP
ncbi:hypothetical protein [Yinghuangia aomiensis]|uniref:hypothetical protein n=1 Tax=Yinghuangia aomiensis TaxID=676205 RepID=UPI0031F0DB05